MISRWSLLVLFWEIHTKLSSVEIPIVSFHVSSGFKVGGPRHSIIDEVKEGFLEEAVRSTCVIELRFLCVSALDLV